MPGIVTLCQARPFQCAASGPPWLSVPTAQALPGPVAAIESNWPFALPQTFAIRHWLAVLADAGVTRPPILAPTANAMAATARHFPRLNEDTGHILTIANDNPQYSERA